MKSEQFKSVAVGSKLKTEHYNDKGDVIGDWFIEEKIGFDTTRILNSSDYMSIGRKVKYSYDSNKGTFYESELYGMTVMEGFR